MEGPKLQNFSLFEFSETRLSYPYFRLIQQPPWFIFLVNLDQFSLLDYGRTQNGRQP